MSSAAGFSSESGAGGRVVGVGNLGGEGEGHFGAAARAAADVKERIVAVEDIEPFANIFHADAGALENAAGVGAAGSDADAVVFHFNYQSSMIETAAQRDDAAADARLQPMLDAVFDERLKKHAGNRDFEGFRIDFPGDGKLLCAEAGDFDGKVVVGGGELVAKRDEGVVFLEHFTQDVGELDDEVASLLGTEANQRGDGVEGVEEEVRIDLTLEGVEAGFEEETLLLFEGLLDADGVPDFQGDADDHGGAGPDGDADKPGVGDQREEAVRHARGPFAQDFHGDDEDEQENLAVDAGTEEGTADPAVEAEIDEGRERPDFFLVDKAAIDAGGDGDGKEKWQGEEFSVEDGGESQNRRADEGGAGAEENAEENGGFEGNVGGVEVGDGDTDPNAQAERDADEGKQAKGLGEGAFVAKEELLKFTRAPQRGGNRRGHTQLDEQGDEDDARIDHGSSVQGTGSRVQGNERSAFRKTRLAENASGEQGAGSARPAEDCESAETLCAEHGFYNRSMTMVSVRKVADADFPTRWGHFRILGFEGVYADDDPARCGQAAEKEEAVALTMGDVHAAPPLVRIHSQCLTGDVFHSLRCDCRLQLELALRKIAEAGAGILIYEQQEGRGIGLMAKLRAYELQDQGLDTVEANLQLGFEADCREFELPAEILRQMGVASVRLMTNNPDKVAALEAAGIRVAERVSAEVPAEDSFEQYLRVKQEKMGHIFESADKSIR